MNHEVKHHTVSHFKGLTSGIDPSSEYGRSRTFILQNIVLKIPNLLHKEAKWQFHVNVTV